MIAKTYTASNLIKDQLVTIEVDLSNQGLPSFEIIGLGDRTLEESKQRVRSAIINSGFTFPIHHLTINLSPAANKKEGSYFDLGVCLSVLLASGQINTQLVNLQEFAIFGEIALDGSLLKTQKITQHLLTAQDLGLKKAIVPETYRHDLESSFLDLEVYFVKNLADAVSFLNGITLITPTQFSVTKSQSTAISFEFDFAQITGQNLAKRALEIAATGHHNVLFYGPPGTGKSLLAKSFPSILPELTIQEASQVFRLYLEADIELKEHQVFTSPFRNPHHSSSLVGMVGGGPTLKPGEISLSHNGVLFLDEMAEFPKSILESIRQPIEDQKITISRSAKKTVYPADFILLASTNLCPCGFFKHPIKQCRCSYAEVRRYQKKLSGPILDRIDLFVSVADIPSSQILGNTKSESSELIKKRVVSGQKFATSRQESVTEKFHNGRLPNKDLIKNINLSEKGSDFLTTSLEKVSISPRSLTRILKVARTIADLDNSLKIEQKHLAESLSYKLSMPEFL